MTERHASLPLIASAAGAYLANGLRAAGVKKRTDLVRAAMLDPQLARLLISKAPTGTNMRPAYLLVGALRRSIILSKVAGAQPSQQKAPGPAGHGRGLFAPFLGR